MATIEEHKQAARDFIRGATDDDVTLEVELLIAPDPRPMYEVLIPVTGFIRERIHASDELEAVELLYEREWGVEDIEQFDTVGQICEGTQFNGMQNELQVRLLDDQEDSN